MVRRRTPERGGRDPGMPLVLTSLKVTGRLITGHTWSIADPDAPVIVAETAIIEPSADIFTDLRCPGCVARVEIGPCAGDTLALVEHQDGCAELAALALRAAS